MKVYENTDKKKFEAVKALLVYGNGKQVFCTMNPIEDNIILSGQGVNARNLSALFDLIGRDPVAAGMQWRNERVLPGSAAETGCLFQLRQFTPDENFRPSHVVSRSDFFRRSKRLESLRIPFARPSLPGNKTVPRSVLECL